MKRKSKRDKEKATWNKSNKSNIRVMLEGQRISEYDRERRWSNKSVSERECWRRGVEQECVCVCVCV